MATWVQEVASRRDDTTFELVDTRDFHLPLFDEPHPPAYGRYQHEHTRQWARTISSFDGFVIVTPEYNHSVPGVLKNAIDYLYAEWADKAVGFVSYGVAGGVRAIEHLRAIAGNLCLADVRSQVALHLATDFEDGSVFTPGDRNVESLQTMLGEVIAWSTPCGDAARAAGGPHVADPVARTRPSYRSRDPSSSVTVLAVRATPTTGRPSSRRASRAPGNGSAVLDGSG